MIRLATLHRSASVAADTKVSARALAMRALRMSKASRRKSSLRSSITANRIVGMEG